MSEGIRQRGRGQDEPKPSKDAGPSEADRSVKRKPWNPVEIRASTDLHTKEQPSLLSMEAPPQNYRGFLNLGVIALFVMNIRLVIENLLKYGLLVRFRTTMFQKWDKSWPSLLTVVFIIVLHPVVAYFVEQWAGRKKLPISKKTAAVFHTLNICCAFFAPLYVIYYSHSSLESGYILAFMCLILTMKLISFAHVSHDIRLLSSEVVVFGDGTMVPHDPASKPGSTLTGNYGSASRGADNDLSAAQSALSAALPPPATPQVSAKSPLQFTSAQLSNDSLLLSPTQGKSEVAGARPDSAAAAGGGDSKPQTAQSFTISPYSPSLRQIYYFLAAPTLVFQLSYPRSPRVRKWFVARRFAELVFVSFVIVFIIEQYVMPTLNNSLVHFDNHDLFPIIERVLKLCVPNTMVWLLVFYALFHSYLNLVAELMRFGDRVFYRDWWNSGDLGIYWRLWNRPVHDWLVRHVYCVFVRAGYSAGVARVVVFFISAALHEVLISIPCHVVSLHAFFAMLIQVPVIIVTQWVHRKSQNPIFGNVAFWCALCVFGQPLLILLYGYQYIRHVQ